jgi:hypothetical protein
MSALFSRQKKSARARALEKRETTERGFPLLSCVGKIKQKFRSKNQRNESRRPRRLLLDVNKRTSNLIFSMITSFILAPKCLGSRTTFFSRRTWKNIFLRFWIRIYTSLLYSLSALSVCVRVCVTTLSPLFFLARVRSRLSCSLLLLLLLDERERERERECARGEKSLQRSGEF